MPITVTHNLDRLREAIAAASIGAKVNVRSLGDSLVVEGMVRDPLDAEEVRRIAAGFAGQEKVINRLKLLAPTQVNPRVRIAEELGRPLVYTPVTIAHLVYIIMLDKKTNMT